LVNAQFIAIATESITNRSTVITEEISGRLVLSAEPELLISLKESVIIEKLTVEHGEATGVDIYFTEELASFFNRLWGCEIVAFRVDYDRVGEWIALDPVGSSRYRDYFSAVLANNLILDLCLFVDYCGHFIDKLPVGEHELIDENQIATFDGDTLSLIAALGALSWVTT
jgi:hypothetical protein